MADKNRFVPQGELSAYERWELPNIGTASNSTRSFSTTKKVKPLTAEDIESIRQQAYTAGFEEGRKEGSTKGHEEGLLTGKEQGYQDGLQQGMSDGQAQVEIQIDKLKNLLSQLSDPLSQQCDQVEQAMMNVAMAVARAVIHRELSLDSSSITAALSQVLKSLPKSDVDVVLTVNPDNQALVHTLLEDLKSNIELQTDPALTAGGCVLETSSQLIDYTIEKRFQKIVYSMLFSVANKDNHSNTLESPATINAMSDFPTETLNEVDLDVESSQIDSNSEPGLIETGSDDD